MRLREWGVRLTLGLEVTLRLRLGARVGVGDEAQA